MARDIKDVQAIRNDMIKHKPIECFTLAALPGLYCYVKQNGGMVVQLKPVREVEVTLGFPYFEFVVVEETNVIEIAKEIIQQHCVMLPNYHGETASYAVISDDWKLMIAPDVFGVYQSPTLKY